MKGMPLLQPFIRSGNLSPVCFDELGYCPEIGEKDLLCPEYQGYTPNLKISEKIDRSISFLGRHWFVH